LEKYSIMIFYTENNYQAQAAKAELNRILSLKKPVKIVEINETRTNKQNNALHLYFQFISNELNDLGIMFNFIAFDGNNYELMYSPLLVKEMVWKPIQMALFGKESTTKLTTNEINKIIDVITLFFAERGVSIEFPSYESFISKNEFI
jgi:hypothetical protein